MTAADQFFSGYYRNPDPRLAAEALAEVLAAPTAPSPMVQVMFARAARLSREIAAEFRALSIRAPAVEKHVERLLATAAAPGGPDPATVVLTDPSVLDFLWGEFLLTGSDAPVRRIAAVLEREDLMLAALTAWAAERVIMPWSKAARAKLASALHARGIIIDPQRRRLGNELDLDLMVWKLMSGGFQVKAEMPFAITDDIIQNMMMKGAACWSLQSNAMQHPIVQRVYEAIPHPGRFPRFV